MGIVVTPIPCVVCLFPAIKVPWSFGIDDKSFVASSQEKVANLLYRLSMASFRGPREPCAQMHADRDVRSSRFFKKIQLADHAIIMEFWIHGQGLRHPYVVARW